MFRDFTNAAKERLKGYIDDVTPHGFWDTLGDRITDFFRDIAGTDVADYAGNIKGYQKRVLDVKNIGKKNIDKLFKTEQGLDDKYSKSLSTACDSYDSGLIKEFNALINMLMPNGAGFDFSEKNLTAFQNASDEVDKASANIKSAKKEIKTKEEEIEKLKEEKKGKQSEFNLFSADPVNLATGNFIYEKTDVLMDGEMPLSFHRFYNAQDEKSGVLGRGYRHNHEVELKDDGTYVTVIMEDGNRRFFEKNADGAYESRLATLEQLEVVSGKDDQDNVYVMTTPEGEKYHFDSVGKMIRREDNHGRGVDYTYNAKDQLIKVENDLGDFLTFAYHEAGQLERVATSHNREVHYTYDNGRLDKVTMANGNRFYYRYTDNGEMQEIKNAREIVTIKNTYDDQCRITRQEFPDGTEMLFEYQGDELVLTERNGSKITYVHDAKLRNTDVRYEDGTTEHYEYNEKSQKILVKDRNGNTTRFGYDNRGNVVKIINGLGQISTMTYDANNRLLTMKVNRVERIRNSYDTKGNLIASVGADGNGMMFAYDEKGRVVRAENADHEVTELAYDEKGNIVSVAVNGVMASMYRYDDRNNVVVSIDGNHNETRYGYDEDDRLIHVINPHGEEASYEYNVSGKVTRVVDFDGHEVSVTYNAINKEENVTDKEGNVTNYTYDSMWNVATVTRPDGGVIRYAYDGNNRLEEVVAPEGNTMQFTYDGNGNLLTETDGDGAITRYTYDALDRRKSMIDPLGNETKYTYDGSGNLVKETDALGNEATYAYDENGRLITETDVLGHTTRYTYTAGGQRKEVIYPNGTCDTYKYDRGQVVEIARSTGENYQYAYDGNGNMIMQRNALGEEVAFSYDAMNQMTSIKLPTGGIRRFSYDKVGHLTEVIDENGHETRYTYSPNGNLTKVEDAAGGVTRYEYDVMGNLIRITRSGQAVEDEVTQYEWNKNDQIIKMIDPLGEMERYVYDMAGRMMQKEDRDGYVTKVSYDKNGNIAGIKYEDDKEVLFSYDALRHLQEMRDWNGVTSVASDALGRVVSVTDPAGQTVKYEWGSVGEKTKMIYPDGSEVSYGYDERGLLTSLITEDGKTEYAYDVMGRIKEKMLPNGIVTKYQYNSIGKLSELQHVGKDVLESYQYTYDLAGNKVKTLRKRNGIEEDNGTFEYGYDALNQLISVTKDGQKQREYAYDAFGNRIVKREYAERIIETVYQYNRNNQLMSDATGDESRRYQYDKRGNLLQVSGKEGIIKQFTFDARNALSEALERKEGIERKVSYQYNGLGNRVGQAWGDALDPERQIRYTLDLTRQYHNMLSETIETENSIHTSQYYYDFNVVAMKKAAGAEYFIQDDLGSAMSVYDQSGALEEAYAYDEFGNEYGNIIDARERFQPFGYTGYQKEAVGDVYFAQARRYDAASGRFVSEDLVRGATIVPISMNHYTYCWNQPGNLVDMNGMWPEWVKKHHKALGIVITVAGILAGVAITALCPVAAPVIAGAVVGATGYLGDKMLNWEKVSVGGLIVNSATGALVGLLPSGAGSQVVSTTKGIISSIAKKSTATGGIEAIGKIATNYFEGKKIMDGVVATALTAGVLAGFSELKSIRFKGDVDTKQMREELPIAVDNMKRVAKTKYRGKIANSVKNAKDNLQKELHKANEFFKESIKGIEYIEQEFKKFDSYMFGRDQVIRETVDAIECIILG